MAMEKENTLLQELNVRERLLRGETISLNPEEAAQIQMVLATKLLAEHEESKKHNARLNSFALGFSEDGQIWHFIMGIKTNMFNFKLKISVKNGPDRLILENVKAKKGHIPIPIKAFESYMPEALYDPTSMWEDEEGLPENSLIITLSYEKADLRIKEEYL